jgi:hypothetical protein
MRRFFTPGLLVMLALALLLAGVVQAQDATSGSIRGTVYRDTNNDGLCVGTGEAGLAGIPVRFTSGSTQLYLQSGADGTFGLVAAGLGAWTVAAEPSADQGVVTSAQSRSVTLTAENVTATGLDFCVGTARSSSVVLPQSGAPAMPGLWIALIAGVLLVGAGLFLALRQRVMRG